MPPGESEKKQKHKTILNKTLVKRLPCEWDTCELTYEDMDVFISHITDHLTTFLKCAAEELSTNPDISLTCKWRECGYCVENDTAAMVRHVLFHAFHVKIKFIGKMQIEANGLSECALDNRSRNMIPELPEHLVCAWENCQAVYDNPEYFYQHVNDHIAAFERGNKPESEVKCYWESCHAIMKSRYKLRDHLRSHSQEKVVACPTCGSLFANNTKFIDHVKRQVDAGDTHTYQCSHCNRRYSTEKLLKDHMRHHVNHYKCPLCDMTCPTPSALKVHMRYRHTDVKPHACPQCDYACKTSQDLRKHMDIHSEQPGYQCYLEDCDFQCKTYTVLTAHYKKEHQGEEQQRPQYMCHICGATYGRGYLLTCHLKKKHKFKWPAGHVRFRYKQHEDGYFRLQTVRYESIVVTDQDKMVDTQTSENKGCETDDPSGCYQTENDVDQSHVNTEEQYQTITLDNTTAVLQASLGMQSSEPSNANYNLQMLGEVALHPPDQDNGQTQDISDIPENPDISSVVDTSGTLIGQTIFVLPETSPRKATRNSSLSGARDYSILTLSDTTENPHSFNPSVLGESHKRTGAQKRKSPSKHKRSQKRKRDLALDDMCDIEKTALELGITILK